MEILLKLLVKTVAYDIAIIETGFNVWLNTTARPEGFYNQIYLENKNIFYTQASNSRILHRYNPSLYELPTKQRLRL